MASFLRPCIKDGAMVRFMSIWDIPEEVICDGCKERIAANEEAAKVAKGKVSRRAKTAFKKQ